MSSKREWPRMSKAELIEAAYEMTSGNVKDLTSEKLTRLMTVTQFVTDLCLNEIERRGELTFSQPDGAVIVPYEAEYYVETVLTRPNSRGSTTILPSWR
jgi:hypothetical protein